MDNSTNGNSSPTGSNISNISNIGNTSDISSSSSSSSKSVIRSKMELKIVKRRGRGNSDPTIPDPRHDIPSGSKNGKRPRTASMEAAMFDEDYTRYSRDHFHGGQQISKPWALEPPPAVFKHVDLDEKVVKHMYWYSHYRLKLRRVSPRSLPFLEKFRDTAAEAIQAPTEELKIQLAAWNYTLHSATILRREPSFEDKEAYKALKELTILRYMADYGDYLGEECLALRMAAKDKKMLVENAEILVGGKTWTMIQKQIKHEEKEWASWEGSNALVNQPRDAKPPSIPTILAIRHLCHEINLDEKNAFYAIRMYSQRNGLMHCKVSHYIKELDFKGLARQLTRDYHDLPSVFGKREHRYMKGVLDQVRDRFFTSIANPKKPGLNTEALRRLARHGEKEANQEANRLRELLAQEKRDAKVKVTNDEDSEEARNKKITRSQDKEEPCEEIGDVSWM